MMEARKTRFRAYQLGSAGSSFSYCFDGHFTLIEGRLTETSRGPLTNEMRACGVSVAETLHITSWDADHCAESELEELLDLVQPLRIEGPGYPPHCEHAERCRSILEYYRRQKKSSNRPVVLDYITPAYISSLEAASALGFRNIFYHPKFIDTACNNNNSSVKLFRGGSFNVLSLGDVEDANISSFLRRNSTLKRETDIMILAHHGADNGFTSKSLLERLRPRLAICSSDYDNKFEHPDEAIRDLLFQMGIPLMTTKTGDVVIASIGDHKGAYKAINLISGSTKVSSERLFRAKKAELLSNNDDTIREIMSSRKRYP